MERANYFFQVAQNEMAEFAFRCSCMLRNFLVRINVISSQQAQIDVKWKISFRERLKDSNPARNSIRVIQFIHHCFSAE